MIKENRNGIRVGAGVRQAELLAWPTLAERQPLLAAALPWIGHAQTRSRGTVCGSIAHADPSAELPLVLVVLGGEVELSSRRRRRSVAAADFFTGMMSTAREPDELIEAVTIPARRQGHGYAFRNSAAGTAISPSSPVPRSRAKIAFASPSAESATGLCTRDLPALDGSALDDALDAFAWELDARDDLHATGRYRRELVRRMGRATIEEARRCA